MSIFQLSSTLVTVFLILASALLAQTESVHSLLPEPSCGKMPGCIPVQFKMSDGLLLRWNGFPERNSDAIEAFDRNGTRLIGIDVYQLIPTAEKISISDVAARRNGSVAIAVVTVEKERIRPWLIQLDEAGRLRKMTELDTAKEIGWLAFDKPGNLWALTNYLGERVRQDSALAGPLILVFNPDGRIVKSLLNQVDFQPGLEEGPKIGEVSFGITDRQVWFWQPAKHQMIIVDQGCIGLSKVSIPHAPTYNLGGRTVLTPTNEVVQALRSPTRGVGGIYLAIGRRIEEFSSPLNRLLVGMDGSEFVFVETGSRIGDFNTIRVSLTELRNLSKL